jgi:hypothetical protein
MALLPTIAAVGATPCRITVVEKGTGWPVPLVELETVHGVKFVTDNAGVIAFDLPEAMGRETWFGVRGFGYGVPRDGLGSQGVRLTPQPGGSLSIEVERAIVARRLGRITGAGIFGESQKLGQARDWEESGIVGCDSVQTAVIDGRLFWAWGDTSLANYPLGIFDGTAARTPPRPVDRFEPPIRLAFDYYRDVAGRPRAIAPMAGDGPTWLTGLATVRDESTTERLVATFLKIKPPLETVAVGLCAWDDAAERFAPVKTIWSRSGERQQPPPAPSGHAAAWTDPDGRDWLLFGNPFPALRCRAMFGAWSDPTAWEVLAPPRCVRSADGGEIEPHSGSIAWNAWRRRWVAVFMQKFGKPSAFGELWYSEAEDPLGPWGPAVKIVSHENYTFYNPRIHSQWSTADSPILVFEATFTRQFADDPAQVARHDYNQVLYRLDLDDDALAKARGRSSR